ncbi:hypothetical protein RHGRI_011983 [Rhododendron griersonianum]|uniref:Uncharacterized protein n=1 Tax=Rhododendron griersonianum TaxID=479676 RepID=A0AAV6KQA3_9ERIC|nr:hypothetical protein RHGRI_011983 [Rhododendron griersonianum]
MLKKKLFLIWPNISDLLVMGFMTCVLFSAELKKKSNKPKRPTVKSLFDNDSETAMNQPAQGSFLNLLPPRLDVSKQSEPV